MTAPCELRPVGVVGLGHYAPPEVVTNLDLQGRLDTTDEWIRSRTGIRERRQAHPGVCASDLALEASRRALRSAGIHPEQLGLIIVGTMTPDMVVPATACLVQNALGARNAGAFDLNVACSGFAYSLAVGSQFVRTRAYDYVLVVGADTMTRVMNWQDRGTCVLFGDGAGAVVLGPVAPGRGILAVHLGADGRGGPHLTVPAGGGRIPGGTPGIPHSGYCLQMNGKEVFKFAVGVMGEAAAAVVGKAGLTADDVALFIPHQANVRIIDAAARRLGVPMERVFVNVDRFGNTSCGSIPLALSEAREQGRIRDGDVVVLVGFGGGLSWGAVAMRWTECGKEAA
ncbi:MAG: beta-ketoacyl-ACP synthase III [Candidatus Eremiobacterota bacterium]